MSKQPSPQPDLDAAAAALAADRRSASGWWRTAGLLIDKVEREGSWAANHPSFTRFVEDLAQRTGRSPNLLWRAYGAVRTWRALSPKVAEALGFEVPGEVDRLPQHITPEIVELLEKMSRVARQEDWKLVVEGAVSGGMTRDILRARWAAMRSSLKGRTRRGRGVATPVLVRISPEPEPSDIDLAIVAAGPACLGHPHPAGWAMFRDVQLAVPDRLIPPTLQFVFAIQPAKADPVELHGVISYNWNMSLQQRRELARDCGDFVDFFWFAEISDTDISEQLANVPHAGLLLYDDGDLHIAVTPWPDPKSGRFIADLAKALLLKQRSA